MEKKVPETGPMGKGGQGGGTSDLNIKKKFNRCLTQPRPKQSTI